MTTLSQRSLAGGELAPVLYARCDTTKYQTGLRTMRNWFTMREGGAQNRPGTEFVGEVKDSTKAVRFIKFVFANDQAYVLEFGDQYMRVIQAGVYLRYPPGSITAISTASQGVFTSVGHGNSNGDQLFLYTVGGMPLLNGRQFIVSDETADTFKLKYMDGTYVNTTGLTYTSGATFRAIFQKATPWVVADLPAIRFAQSADVLTLVHAGYEPRELRRASAYVWNITSLAGTAPDIGAPAFNAIEVGMNKPADASDIAFYKVTMVRKQTLEESLPSAAVSSPADGTSADPNIMLTVSPTLAAGNGQFYRFYKGYSIGGAYGLVLETTSSGYSDYGDTPNYAIQPPVFIDRFHATGDYPQAVTYAQQRLVLGGSTNAPERADASKIGYPRNFTIRSPLQDDDALAWQCAGRQINRIQHMLTLSKLIQFTDSGEWVIEGGQSGELTPSTINPKQHTYNGSGVVAPVVIDDNALYVQGLGSIVRDLSYDFNTDGYRGNDITTFSTHLFKGYTIVDFDFQKVPNSIAWAVRSDGTLLGCTYVREQQILAWHRHDFEGGTVENICVVPEELESRMYMLVKRTVNGRTVRYVERMTKTFVNDVKDCIYMDSALSYDGRITSGNNLTFVTTTNWTHQDTQTCNAGSAIFAASNVGDYIFTYDPATGDECRFEIVTYTNSTQVIVRPEKTVPAALQTALLAGVSTWSLAVDTISGLSHLEGKAVSILADGFVIANPHNSSMPTITVSGGQITLPRSHAYVHIGLPITADLETLDIDTASAETLAGKKMQVGKVILQLEKTRGLFVGPKPPPDEDDNYLGGLVELKVRQYEAYNDPVELKTGKAEVVIAGQWSSNGRIFIRQTDPLPASVLSIMPDGHVPIRQSGS